LRDEAAEEFSQADRKNQPSAFSTPRRGVLNASVDRVAMIASRR
jgi:hypothetical protein